MGGQRWGDWKSQKPGDPGKEVQVWTKKVRIGIWVLNSPPSHPRGQGLRQRQAGNVVRGALAGRSSEGSWQGQEREAMPATTGTRQRPANGRAAKGQAAKGRVREPRTQTRHVRWSGPSEAAVHRERLQGESRQK